MESKLISKIDWKYEKLYFVGTNIRRKKASLVPLHQMGVKRRRH
jgi:hypothetical protein